MEFTIEQRKLIQETMEKYTSGGKGVTSIVLYKKIGSFLNMEQKEFQPKLSRAINTDEISGYVGRKRAGYFRASQFPKKEKETESKVNEEVEQSEPTSRQKEEINITTELRLRCDALNWTIEKKMVVGENLDAPIKAKEENLGQERWQVIGHYGTVSDCAMGLLNRHSHLLGVGERGNLRELLVEWRQARDIIMESLKKVGSVNLTENSEIIPKAAEEG